MPHRVRSQSARLLVGLFAVAPATAQTPIVADEAQVLLPAELGQAARFGFSIDAEASTAVIGAPQADLAGAIFIYSWNGSAWSLEHRFDDPDDLSYSDSFGAAVAVSGDDIAVGEAGQQHVYPGAGLVHLFRRTGSGWIRGAVLAPETPGYLAAFGASVSLHGDRLLVGAPQEDGYRGAAYVFERAGGAWLQAERLSPPDLELADGMGRAVALHGDHAAVGAPGDDDAGDHSGAVHVYERRQGVWIRQAKLLPDGQPGESFGWSVDIQDDTLVVGAIQGSSAAPSSGCAYVFVLQAGAWVRQAKLAAAGSAQHDEFGARVSLCGDRIAVGARRNDEFGTSAGIAYTFFRRGERWEQELELVGSAVSAGDQFSRVALCGERLLVGAPESGPPLAVGATYVFELERAAVPVCVGDGSGAPCPCGNETGGSPAGCGSSSGAGVALAALGSSSVGTDELRLVASDLPAGGLAHLLAAASLAGGGGAGPPFGDGLRCLGGRTLRVGSSAVDADGTALWGPGLLGVTGWSAGESHFLQVLYRDPTGPCGSGLNSSNALRLRLSL